MRNNFKHPKLFATSSSFLLAPFSTSLWSWKFWVVGQKPDAFTWFTTEIPEGFVGFQLPDRGHCPYIYTEKSVWMVVDCILIFKSLTGWSWSVRLGAPGPWQHNIAIFSLCHCKSWTYLSIIILVSDSREAAFVVNSVFRSSSLSCKVGKS